MLFTSPTFLFVFLPALLAIYFLSPKLFRNTILLFSSLLFYAWGEVFYVAVLLLSIGFNYGMGLAIHAWRETPSAKLVMLMACFGNLALLGFYKYANFIVDNVNFIVTFSGYGAVDFAPIHLPIGISFFTFQALSYLVDVYRRTSQVQKNPLDLALYIALFPQLIAGPIIRYHDVASQIQDRRHTLEDVYFGFRRFVFGLAKKLLIANPLGFVADQIFDIPASDLTAPIAWLGIVAYSLQLYFDFSAYSCMAIGLGRIFGFRFLENFNYPYISQSIQEFWRRWHISLSNWFRDYLYIPLGGNRRGIFRTYMNLLAVFFLCGLWHGASWNFIVWGLLHGAFLVLERLGLSRILLQLWRPLRHFYVLLVVMVAWVFFRSENLPYALDYVQAMAGFGDGDNSRYDALFYMTPECLLVLLAGVLFSTPLWSLLEIRLEQPRSGINGMVIQLVSAIYCLTVFWACLLYVAAGSYNPFIYFRF